MFKKKPNQVSSWDEVDGIIFFHITSDGTTGDGWISRLEDKGVLILNQDKDILRSSNFKPTSDVTSIVAVMKGSVFNNEDDRVTKKIIDEANKRGWKKPSIELVPLIRDKYSDDDLAAMGIYYIVVMHEPIKTTDGKLKLLSVARDTGRNMIYGITVSSGNENVNDQRWARGYSFAFEIA